MNKFCCNSKKRVNDLTSPKTKKDNFTNYTKFSSTLFIFELTETLVVVLYAKLFNPIVEIYVSLIRILNYLILSV